MTDELEKTGRIMKEKPENQIKLDRWNQKKQDGQLWKVGRIKLEKI